MILCIEDEALLLHTRSLVLQSAGFGVLTARTPREALELFNGRRVDAVLLGYNLRGIDGGALASQMKTAKPHIPIMMLGGECSVSERARWAVDLFMANGDGPHALINAVRKLVGTAAW